MVLRYTAGATGCSRFPLPTFFDFSRIITKREANKNKMSDEKRIAVVCGTYRTLEDEILFVKDLLKGQAFDVIAVNRASMLWRGKIKYLVSHHFDRMKYFRHIRTTRDLDDDYLTVSVAPHPGVDRVEPNLRHNLFPSGSSGLFGVLLALEYRYQKVITIGIGLAGGTADYNQDYTEWREAWDKAAELNHLGICSKVRGVSGYPAQVLGMPTKVWIDDD